MKSLKQFISEKKKNNYNKETDAEAVTTGSVSAKPDIPSFLKPEKKFSTIEDKPVFQPVEKPKSKVIRMIGNEVVGSGTQSGTSSSTPVVVPGRQPHQRQLPSPIYTVGDRDTIKGIATKHGLSEKEFLELNKGVKPGSTLRPGVKVRTRKGP